MLDICTLLEYFFFAKYFYSLHFNTKSCTFYGNILCYLSIIYMALPTHNAGIWEWNSTINYLSGVFRNGSSESYESLFTCLWVFSMSSFALNKLIKLPSLLCGGWEEEETGKPRGHRWHPSVLSSLNVVHMPFKHVFLLLNLSSAHVVRKASLPYHHIYWYLVFQKLKWVPGRVWRATFLHCFIYSYSFNIRCTASAALIPLDVQFSAKCFLGHLSPTLLSALWF